MAHKFYNTKAWQAMRVQAMANSAGLCVLCGVKLLPGRSGPRSAEIDHIQPHRGDRDAFFDPDNVQALCKGCHGSVKQKQERGFRMQRADGW